MLHLFPFPLSTVKQHLEVELRDRVSQLEERGREVQGLKERLGALLTSRGELDTLKDMLTALKREEEVIAVT